jgi:hypothetical protein
MILTPVYLQTSRITRLPATQRVKDGRREDYPPVENFDHLAMMCFLVAVLVKYFFRHRLALQLVSAIDFYLA